MSERRRREARDFRRGEAPDTLNEATLFYDADCGFCRWAVAKVARWDRRHALRLVTLQDAGEADRLLGPLDPDARMASWHLVTADGRIHSAGGGVGPLLRLLPGGGTAARLTEAVQPATDAAYRFVAEHRSAFGRLLTRGARRRADATLRRAA
jgi:predicted DCC family thiol-disulfide oxidoreductase YuxK